MPITEVSQNVLATLIEMDKVCDNPRFELNPRPRIVMDTAFYIVTSLINSFFTQTDTKSHHIISHHLAGNEMITYLCRNKTHAGHYIRQVNNTYALLVEKFNLPLDASFFIYPAIQTNGHDQYTIESKLLDLSQAVSGSSLVF